MNTRRIFFGLLIGALGIWGTVGHVQSVQAAKKKTQTLTLAWELAALDDKGKPTACAGADEICTVHYSLVLRRGSLKVATLFSGKESMKSFIIDAWGPCTGKNKRRGLLCGLLNHDCGDSCYADVVAVKVKKQRLIIEKYEGCRGGEDCTTKPKQILSKVLTGVKIKLRK